MGSAVWFIKNKTAKKIIFAIFSLIKMSSDQGNTSDSSDSSDCKMEIRPRQRRRSVSFSEEITIIGFSEPCVESVMYESESHRQIIGIQELYLSDHEFVKNGKFMGKSRGKIAI